MTAAPFLEIKNWRAHQHYGKRRPPWIKLYTRLLDDAAFMALPESAQGQLVKLWVLAATMCHPLPNDPKFLAGKIGVRGKFYLDAILASGMLIPCYQNASNVLAKDAQNARPLSTENREQRTETSSSSSARAGDASKTLAAEASVWRPIEEQRLAERLTSDAGRNALSAVLATSDSKVGVVSMLVAMLDGMHPPRVAPAHMDAALIEYAANGMSAGRFNAKHFRRFAQRAAEPEAPDTRGATRRDPGPDPFVAGIEQWAAKGSSHA